MYEYANARIRALRGRLLRPADLAALAQNADLAGLIHGLSGTDYGVDVEEARRTQAGSPLVDAAVRRNLGRRTRDVLTFFETEDPERPRTPRRLVTVLLARKDVANLVAVIRARAAGASSASALAATSPIGLLTEAQLAALAEASDAATCLMLARQFGTTWAPLPGDTGAARSRSRWATGDSPVTVDEERLLRLEFALWAAAETREAGGNGQVVRALLATEADARNVVLALRLVWAGTRPGRTQLAELFAPGGSLTQVELERVVRQASVLRAVEAVEHTPFGRAMGGSEALLLDDVVGLEWAVERYVAQWARAQVFRDPLGIGLCVAYLAAKSVEARSLRLVARGLAGQWPRGRVEQLLAA